MTTGDDHAAYEDPEAPFETFALAALHQAMRWAQAEGVPIQLYRQVAFTGTSNWTQNIASVVNYQQLLQRHQDEIVQLPETQACIRALWDAGILRYLLPHHQRATAANALTEEQQRQLAWHIIYPLVDILQRRNTYQPTAEQVRESYMRFRDGWTSTAHKHVAIIPLLNLRAQLADSARVSVNFEITPFSDEEKGWMWTALDSFNEIGLIPFRTFLATQYKLVGERMLPDINRADDLEQASQEFGRSHQNMLNELRNIVTAFRLIKPGDVAITTYIEQSDQVPPDGGLQGVGVPGLGISDFQVRRGGSEYIFSEDDIPEVYALIEALGQLDSRPHRAGIEIGLRRFNQSYSRDYYEDRLIDLTVALESTLLAGADGKTELRYRFALFGAALLAHQQDARKVQEFLLKMYDARSVVVHAGKSLFELKQKALGGYEWRAFAQACEDIARSILIEYVRRLNSHPDSTVQSLNEALESQIVRGLGAVDQD